MRITRRRSWADLRDRIGDDLARNHPEARFAVSGPDEAALIAWHEGPSESAVAAVVGDLAGWDVVAHPAHLAAPEAPEPADSPVLLLRRSYSDEALAVAVVRFQASNVRPYSSANPAHRAPMGAILDTEDPADCDYPLVARMAAILAESLGDRPDDPGLDDADRLSLRLCEIGYDTLWNRAWLDVDL